MAISCHTTNATNKIIKYIYFAYLKSENDKVKIM